MATLRRAPLKHAPLKQVPLQHAAVSADSIVRMGKKTSNGSIAAMASFLKTSWAILRETVRHPNTTVVIDRSTGKATPRR